MTSAKRIAANRANARKSRGPQTEAGKQRASRNAFRHGLSSLLHREPVIDAEIEQMAKAICGDDTNSLLLDQAVVIAENELLLRNVRRQKIAVIERLHDPWLCSLSKGDRRTAMANLRFRQMEIAYAEFSWLAAKLRKEGKKVFTFVTPGDVKPDEPVVRYEPIIERDEHDAIQKGLSDLALLLRYERRAWSRRRTALYKFIAIKLTRPTFDQHSDSIK